MRLMALAAMVTAFLAGTGAPTMPWPEYDVNPFVIELKQPAEDEGIGGLVAADLNGDGLLDFLVTKPGSVGAYDHFGKTLWVREIDVRVAGSSERHGLPGWHGPGVTAGDIDGDGKTEVLFLTHSGALHICRAETGDSIRTATPWKPEPVAHWEHLILANLRGEGDRDVILQATPHEAKYRTGNHLAAFALDGLDGEPLWYTDKFHPCAHNGARVADLDGDGRDEILGGTILGPDGKARVSYPEFRGHFDSVFVADVRPDVEGLEVVFLEEGANGVGCLGLGGVLWHTDYKRQEPQNAAIGEFDPSRPGLEAWCRSRYNEHQKPFTFDARGELIGTYNMDDVAPKGWTARGVEVIWTIDWDGGPRQYAAAKERHESGDICVFDPITGKFIRHWPEQADRIFVADIAGDAREEIVVVSGDEIHVHWNEEKNPHPPKPSPWTQQHYRRSKMTYNYYSP